MGGIRDAAVGRGFLFQQQLPRLLFEINLSGINRNMVLLTFSGQKISSRRSVTLREASTLAREGGKAREKNLE